MDEIKGEADYGVRGLLNLFGIESPGFTSSLAIGEYVKKTPVGEAPPIIFPQGGFLLNINSSRY